MKRMLLALAAAAGLVGSARADWNGFRQPPAPPAGVVPAGGGNTGTLAAELAAPPTHPPEKYGLLPALKKVFNKGGCSSCDACGKGGKVGHGGFGHGGYPGYGPGMGGDPVMQGTLVFPNHTFVRSPRDFFMWGAP